MISRWLPAACCFETCILNKYKPNANKCESGHFGGAVRNVAASQLQGSQKVLRGILVSFCLPCLCMGFPPGSPVFFHLPKTYVLVDWLLERCNESVNVCVLGGLQWTGVPSRVPSST